jgi:hypothetical protein
MRHIAYAGPGSLNTPTFWTCYSVDHKTGTILQKKTQVEPSTIAKSNSIYIPVYRPTTMT